MGGCSGPIPGSGSVFSIIGSTPAIPPTSVSSSDGGRSSRVLEANPVADDLLDRELQAEGLRLRVVVREIPPVFGSFF